jgi:hypothetical protein
VEEGESVAGAFVATQGTAFTGAPGPIFISPFTTTRSP